MIGILLPLEELLLESVKDEYENDNPSSDEL